MPELTFSPSHVLGPDCLSLDPLLRASVENIISNILLLHSHNLEAFHLYNTWIDNNLWCFSHENVCKWVRYAACLNVQHLTLSDGALEEIPPPALFSCSHLVTLSLDDYVLTSFPINFIGFPHLISCRLCDVQLTDESLVSLISLCPLLQKLEIIGDAWLSNGLSNVVIFSSTIEHLSMERVKSLSVNCPKLKMLSGCMIDDLSVNGVRFYELSSADLELKMHCASTPRELSLKDYSEDFSPSRFLDIVGNFQSLKELTIDIAEPFEKEEEMDVPLMNLLQRLPNLQSLYMLGFFVQELARDPIPACLASPHVNLKKINVEILEFDYKEIAVIGCLLQSTPFLERMEIQLPDEYDERQYMHFFKEILYLRRASLLARIVETQKKSTTSIWRRRRDIQKKNL